MLPDQKLSEHFSLYELTATSNAALQAANRDLTPEQLGKLCALAALCEELRAICGNTPMRVHSGYRSPALNGNTAGSSSTSQHPRCEAVDFDIPGQTLQESFDLIRAAARAGKIKFGQLIIERAERSYGIAEWVHCSVIGTLDPLKVGMVMEMQMVDGKPHYILVEKFNFATPQKGENE
ncbi:MAG: DUF882 domain-containing protein [Patescibacteria group bacterium]|nr:DUF882 domain-containing protein [Patescibacteria group bacterium]